MIAQHMVSSAVDPDGKWLYRVGGIAAIVLVVGYFLSIALYTFVGEQPASGVEAQLVYFADHAAAWWAIVLLMVFTDLLLLPIFFGIYLALKHVNKGLMLVALTFTAFLFVFLDLALTWTAFSTMISAGVSYAAATTEAERAALAAAAIYPSVIVDSPLVGTYAIVFPALGVLFASLVMLKGVFSRATAYIGVAMGLTGVLWMGSFFVDGLDILRYINAILAMVFYLLVGIRLYRLGSAVFRKN